MEGDRPKPAEHDTQNRLIQEDDKSDSALRGR